MLATSFIHNFELWLGEALGFALLVAFFVVKKFGKGDNRRSILQIVNGILDQRAARIDAQLRAAEESRAEARHAREEGQAQISRAREEAEHIVERAQGMRGSLREEFIASAEEEKNRIVAQARDEIEAERNRAVLELRTQAADAAIDAARDVLRQTMDDPTDRSIIERALNAEPNGHAEAEDIP